MAGGDVDIVRKCGVCGTEIETFSVKKENMMLGSSATVMCPKCQTERPEVREVAGRLAAIDKEVASYPSPNGPSASSAVPDQQGT